jgi:glycosyltransferase involved in cell wall biosynthesis
MTARRSSHRHLLCVANFPSNTGFAWDFIEGLYDGLSRRLEPRGVRTWVAYPRVESPPAALADGPAEAIEHTFRLRTRAGRLAARALVERLEIGTLYLTDRSVWDPAYRFLRAGGLGTVVVHDHTSGERTRPRGPRAWMKDARNVLVPGALADRVLAVSDFVARRKVEVDRVPAARVSRVWNSVEVPDTVAGASERAAVRRRFGLDPRRPLVACAGRATPEKGIDHLLRAFGTVMQSMGGRDACERPALVYLGDGPALDDLRRVRDSLAYRDDVRLAGYVEDAASIVGAADVAAVPSVWAEAFGLAALEPLARGVPVVASRAGGLPEVVRDGVDGLLVPPGDEHALAEALVRLLADPDERARMGAHGRARARERFSREAQLSRLEEIFVEEMGL